MIFLNFIKRIGNHVTFRFPLGRKCGKKSGSGISAGCVLLGLSLPLSLPVQADAAFDQQLDTAIREYIHQTLAAESKRNRWQGLRFVTENSALSTTHNLTLCTQAIAVTGNIDTSTTRQHLILECRQPVWTVKVSSKVQIYLPVVFSNTVIERGTTIEPGMLKRQEMEITRSNRGFYHRIDQVAGMSAKRRIRSNQPLNPGLIDLAHLVRRGEKVRIVANRDGISASMPGEALQNGASGELIQVKNLSSGKTVDAKVLDTGVVTTTY